MAERLDRGERERQTAHIAFESMETFLKVLTPDRWVLLRTLRSRGPSSIRFLAQTLGRDYRGVHADVAVLPDDLTALRRYYERLGRRSRSDIDLTPRARVELAAIPAT